MGTIFLRPPPMPEIDPLSEQIASYLKPEDVAQVEEAFRFSKAAHAGQ
jgi:(p)ppGpp synthase/HD superfamily hydrolase